MPLGATDLTVHRPKPQPWLGPLFLDIAYDYLDAESLDYVRALWRLRRIRKSKARREWARFQAGSLQLPAPKNPPKPSWPDGLDNNEFFHMLQAKHRALELPQPYEIRKLYGDPADGYQVDILRRAKVLPTPARGRSRGGLHGSYNTATPETLFTTTNDPRCTTSESLLSDKLRGGSVGLFSGVSLKDVKIGGGKAMDFKGEGDFVVKVTEVKGGETRKREKYFEVIHEVVETTIPDVQPVGSKTNLFCMLQGSGQDLGLQNMKEILCTLSDLNPHSNADADKIAQISDEEWVKIAELACAEPKTFGGKLVNVSVTSCAVKNPKPNGRTSYLRRRYTPNVSASKADAKGKK